MKNDITITTLHFEIHDPFREELTTMISKLFQHHEKITRARVTIEGLYPANSIAYCVRVNLATPGPDLFVSARDEHLLKAFQHAIDMAERKLTERARIREEQRDHPHSIDFGKGLPKIESVV